jgi:hypothetical protein
VAVAQLVEPLVVVQVVVGSSPISHLRLPPRGRALPGLARIGFESSGQSKIGRVVGSSPISHLTAESRARGA